MRSIARWILASMLLLGAGVGGNAAAQVCTNVPLPAAGIGPVDPANGFPRYYDDSTAVAVVPCLDPNPLGPCGAGVVLPNPALAVAFPGNFPQEFSYWGATATMTMPTGGKAVLVHGVFGSFLPNPLTGAVTPTAGLQLAFSRLRVRILGLLPFGTYTITHPYGVETFVANNQGVINQTIDTGNLAPGFFGPVSPGSRVGDTFLKWDAALPPAPAGTIGDGLTPHTVTGSPCGTNFFRVEGPLIRPGGVQTNLFVVVGKTIDLCGDGIVQPGEECDDGNKLAGDCCSPTCKFEPLGSPCTAPTICTNNACDGAGVCGSISLNDGIACSDANACTVGDTCTAGACVGTPKNCVDGNPCTTDLCTPPTVGCENLNNALLCDDGNPATTGDSCSGGGCMGFTSDAKLILGLGENPSLAGFPAVGDARTDGTSVRVSLTNMDPARYPAGCAGASITFGGIAHPASVTPFAAQAAPLVRATAVNFQAPGTLAAGSTVSLRVSCTVGGVIHTTRWSGTVPNPVIPCTPTTCAARGKNCGTIPDGCGGTLTCGICTAPNTCGGAGVANVCGVCTPTTCAALGKNCGTVPDGCGGTLTCGVCTAPNTCGGAGVANVCGVAPPTALLTLTATGRAGETIASTPAGLSVRVGTTGSSSFPVGTRITLRDTNGRSVIWSGVCSSGGVKTPSCTFTLNAASSETGNVQ